MRILIADKFQQSGIDRLVELGCDVVLEPDTTAGAIASRVTAIDPDALIVRSTKVSEEVLKAGNKLVLVIRAGAGYDTIDVKAASGRGIFVANCPGKNSIAVAELTWALILAADRRIPDQTADLRMGVWNKKEYSKARGLYGRNLGVIGLGQIGREVVKRGKAFGMNILAWSRSLSEEIADSMEIGFRRSPIDVAKDSDVVTMHLAATDETKNLVNDQFCNALRPGAIFINTSRGSIVDEKALCKAIREKNIRVGLDVFNTEPPSTEGEFSDDIVKQAGAYGTHHVGASTDQAQEAVADEAVRIVEHYKRSGQVMNCVNLAETTPATKILTVRMLNRPGVLAHVFYILGQAGINIEEMDNIIYEGAVAACAHIALDEAPGDDLLVAIRANPNVLSASVGSI